VAGQSPDGAVPVERAELATTDMDQLTELIRQRYVEYRVTFRHTDRSRAGGAVRTATVGGLTAGLIQYTGLEFSAQLVPVETPLAVALSQGSGNVATAREELGVSSGDVIMSPTELVSHGTFSDPRYLTVQVSWDALRSLAATGSGLPAHHLRFEAMAPVSPTARRFFVDTTKFIYDQLITNRVSEIHPLIAAELTRLAAATMLRTFPNSTMTVSFVRGPGWVPPAATRRAAEFIEAHADQPLTLDEIAAVAGVTGRALQYAFRRHYDVTPIGYLRQVRLERAHAQLLAADPGGSLTVAAVARRWGWTTPSQFALVYQRRFGELPSRTLRG
jgi:AraC-like DNA-binding protein